MKRATTGDDLEPFVAVGNDELGPLIPPDAIVKCRHNRRHTAGHEVEYGRTSDGQVSRTLAFYQCGKRSFLCGLAGRLMPGEELVDTNATHSTHSPRLRT